MYAHVCIKAELAQVISSLTLQLSLTLALSQPTAPSPRLELVCPPAC